MRNTTNAVCCKRLVMLLLGLLLAAQSSLAMAFGADGHRTVAAIAEKLMAGTPADAKVRALLETGETLEEAAVWADCAKGFSYCGKPPTAEMDAFVAHNHQHHQYHYADIPIQVTHYAPGKIGTTDHDVVQIIIEATAALRGETSASANPHAFTRRQALLLLMHMVGDVHQPLHVGSVYLTPAGVAKLPTAASLASGAVLPTEGENQLFIDGGPHEVHGYWDSDVVKVLMKQKKAGTPQALAQALLAANSTPVTLSANPANDVTAWADESLKASRTAFKGLKVAAHRTDIPDPMHADKALSGWTVTLPATYEATASSIAAQRLTLAGKRLAAILEYALQ
jgi:hypothetical protein